MVLPKLSKRETVLVATFTVALTGYLYYTSLIAPRLASLAAERTKTEELMKDLERAKLSARLLYKWNAAVTEAQTRWSILPLPKNSDLSQFILELYSMAKDNGVRLLSLVPQQGSIERGYLKVPVTVSFSGEYGGVVNLLDAIKGDKGTLFIDEAKFTRTQSKDDLDGNITVDLSGFTLLRKGEVSAYVVEDKNKSKEQSQ